MPLLIFALFGAAAAALGSKQKQTIRLAWEAAAADLGLAADGGDLFRSPKIWGMIDGIRVVVSVRRGGQNDSNYTQYEVHHQPVGPPVSLKRQSVFSRLSSFFGSSDLVVGDPFFDERVVVNTRQEGAVREFLTPARRAAVLQVFDRYKNCEITHSSILAETTRVETDRLILIGTVRRLIDIAKIMGDPTAVNAALTNHQEGALAEAAADLHALNEAEHNLFTETLEAEALIELGEHQPAAQVFEAVDRELTDAGPGDGWEALAAKPAPVSLPAQPIQRSAGPQHTVIDDLFNGSRLSYQIVEHFEERYAGTGVSWSGTVNRFNAYRHDTDFGEGPGVKAMVLLGGSGSSALISNEVHAIVQFGEGTPLDRDAYVSFTGTLARVDRFARKLYITQAQLV